MSSPQADLAHESGMIDGACQGRTELFTYSWPGPVVVLGRGQDAASIDLAACAALGVPVLRRETGGRAVVHQGDLAVTLALPSTHPWARTIPGLYDRFLDVLHPALRAIDPAIERAPPPAPGQRTRSPVCFEDVLGESLLARGRKVVGCAQARRSGAVLVHGHVALGLDAELHALLLGVSPERIRAAIGVLEAGTAGPAAVRRAVEAAFVRVLDPAGTRVAAVP